MAQLPKSIRCRGDRGGCRAHGGRPRTDVAESNLEHYDTRIDLDDETSRASAHRSPSSPQVQRYKIRRPTAKKDVPKILPGDHPARLRLSHGQTPSRGGACDFCGLCLLLFAFQADGLDASPRIASTAPGQKPSLNVCPLSARLAAANRSLIIQPYAAATVRRQNKRHGPWRESRCRASYAPKPGSQPNDQPPISDQVCRKNSAKCA